MSLNIKGNGALGARIRMFREKRGLTQKALGAMLNKGESTVRMWELGRSEPDVDTLKLLASEFNISMDTLTGAAEDHGIDFSTLSEDERSVLYYYRTRDDIRYAIDTMISAAKDDNIALYTAANSESGTADTLICLRKEKWERIKNAPETDDPLM